ncbi:MAG: hypothetical protein JWM07_354 [Candidatus Saccharibacteria bacterium]|jgi:hypothetical protein|nr:hypothetical protein [Candidatus Saccharibacteria bacterium]
MYESALLLLVQVSNQEGAEEMKKIIYILIVAIFSFILASETGLFEALFMFFLLGIVPGTQIVIPANIMLLMISAVICIILFYQTARTILHNILSRHAIQQKSTNNSRLPKQRFSEI